MEQESVFHPGFPCPYNLSHRLDKKGSMRKFRFLKMTNSVYDVEKVADVS